MVGQYPKLTGWVEDNIEYHMLQGIMPYIAYAISNKWPEDEETKNETSPAVNGLPGLPSGPSDATTSASPTPNSGI